VGFGALFKDLYVDREDAAGKFEKTVKVPIAWGPKEKYLRRSTENTDMTGQVMVAMTLPRISFRFINLYYDSARALNKLTPLRICDPNDPTKIIYRNQAVPYTFDYELVVMTNKQNEMFQIVEQFLPMFKPQVNLQFQNLTAVDAVVDVPVTIKSVLPDDTYTGDMTETQHIIWTFVFSLSGWLYGPTRSLTKTNTIQITLYDDGDIPPLKVLEIDGTVDTDAPSDTPFCDTIEISITEFD